jgi:hypothetical protein
LAPILATSIEEGAPADIFFPPTSGGAGKLVGDNTRAEAFDDFRVPIAETSDARVVERWMASILQTRGRH